MQSKIFVQVLLPFIFALTFAFSYFTGQFQIEGDQVHYARAYAAMDGLDLIEALRVYPTIIHTAEPVHLLIIWVFSSIGIEKNTLMSVANALLAVLFAKFIHQKKGAGILMTIWITFSSYYLYTMFFTLERTKFAFIFILVFLLTQKRRWLLFAVFSHSLMLIPVALNLLGQRLFGQKSKLSFYPGKNQILKVVRTLVVIGFLTLLFSNLGEHIYYKFLTYSDEKSGSDSFEGLSLLLLCIFTLLTNKDKRAVLLFYLGLLLLAVLMGSSRINMIGYFAYLYFSNFRQQAFKFSSAMISAYLLYKTWDYLEIIYLYGV